jgi:hypothetical protein
MSFLNSDDIKIHDNFLTNEEFKVIQNTLMSEEFPWYFNPYVNNPSEKELSNLNFHQFIHNFYKNNYFSSDFVHILYPIIHKLNPSELIRIKANLLINTEKNINFGFHVDQTIPCKSAVFYVNSNDGKTIIDGYGEINSVENRLIIFDCKLSHTGTTCTDKKSRVVINFNYV